MKLSQILAIAALAATASAAHAVPLTVDGDLSDWGINVADGTVGNTVGTNYTGLRSGLIGSMIEDTSDLAGDSGYVGPNYGGQNYDGEFMGWALQGNQFHVAILTGQRPDNGLMRFSPGDLRIETSNGIFGIEIGGGAGGGAGTALQEGAAGSTYTTYSNGYTQAHNNADPLQTTGSIWSNTDWILDPINPKGPVQMEINNGSTNHGTADFIYTRNDPNTTQHSVIEMSFSTDIFKGSTIYGMYWLPSCGNDELKIVQDYTVSEPTPLIMLGIGLLGMGLTRLRRKG